MEKIQAKKKNSYLILFPWNLFIPRKSIAPFFTSSSCIKNGRNSVRIEVLSKHNQVKSLFEGAEKFLT